MGIFGGDKSNQSIPVQADPAAGATPAAASNTDGILPPSNGHDDAMQQSVDSVMAQTPPTPTEQTAATADYIMTEPPAHVAEPAYPSDVPAVTDTPAPAAAAAPAATGSDDLSAIRQQALLQLSPLVGHLNQSPEERFQTTMMMLQATDDQSLVKVAYEAAQSITDEKAKAQALLDIVNEINYFTNQQKSS